MYTLPGNKQEAKADLVNSVKPKTAIVKTKTCQITGASMCIAIFNVFKCVAKCVYVTGFGKMCIVHTSNFSTSVTHKISYE